MDLLCLIMFILISTILSLLMAVAAWFLSDKDPDKEKLSPYECGFDPFGQTGHPISIKFFLVAMLFLVFDLEVSLLLPWSFSLSQTEWFNQIIVWIFLMMLAWGLLYEWTAGGLEWE